MKPCVKCKAELPDSAGHCIYCGVGQPAPALQPKATMMGHPGLGKQLLQDVAAAGTPEAMAVAQTMAAPSDANQVIAQARQQQQLRQRGDSQPVHYGGAPQGQPHFAAGPQGQPPYGAPQQPYPNTPPQGQSPYAAPPGQAPYGAPQQPYPNTPPQGQSPYGAPQQQAYGGQQPYPNTPPQGQSPYGAPQQPYGNTPPQGQQPYGAAQGQQPYGNTPPQGQQPYGGPQQQLGAAPDGRQQSPFGGANLGVQHAQFGAAAQEPFGKRDPVAYRDALTEQVKPLRAPGSTRELEQWDESLTTQMLVFGVLLIACFVAPWAVGGEATTFSWTIFGVDGVPWSQKLMPILLAATGVVAVGLGALKLSGTSRAFAATAIGLAPLLFFVVDSNPFRWQLAVGAVGSVMLISGLIVRSRFPDAKMARIITSFGVMAVIALYVVPSDGAMLIKGILSQLADNPGKAKVIPIVGMGGGGLAFGLLPLLLTVLALVVWLPAPKKAGTHTLAWTILLWGLVASIAGLLVGGAVVDALKADLFRYLYLPLAQVAWMSLACFGVAGVLGSQLEN